MTTTPRSGAITTTSGSRSPITGAESTAQSSGKRCRTASRRGSPLPLPPGSRSGSSGIPSRIDRNNEGVSLAVTSGHGVRT
jgi:hypothetical protein